MPRQLPEKATYDLAIAFLFPRHETRAEYVQSTGKQPPPFDYNRRVKYWEDPTALQKGLQEGENITYVTAHSIIGQPFFEKDGKTLRTGTISLSPEQAATVNLPDPGTTTPQGGLNAYEVPPPIALLDQEKLEFGTGLGNTVIQIRRMDWPKDSTVGSAGDPAILKDIQATLQAVQRDVKAIKSNLGAA